MERESRKALKSLSSTPSMFLLLSVLAAGSVFASEKTPTWTILLYGHGDHNLSGSLANDLLKIEEVGSSDTFRVVGQVDFDASRVEVASWRELHMQDEKDDDLLLAAHVCYDMAKYPAVREAFGAFAQR